MSFVNFWWSLSETINLNDYYYSKLEPVLEKKEYYLGEMKQQFRDTIDSLMFAEYVTNKGFRLSLMLPNMEAVELTSDWKAFAEKALSDSHYCNILNACFGNFKDVSVQDEMTVLSYKLEFDRVRQNITKHAQDVQMFMKQFVFDIQKTNHIILHADPNYTDKAVFAARGKHQKGDVSVLTSIDNVLYGSDSTFIVRNKDVTRIKAPSFLFSMDKDLMNVLYQPWGQETVEFLHDNSDIVKEHCNVYTKVKNSMLSDHDKLLIVAIMKDHRLPELISDAEIKQKALEMLNATLG